MKMLARLDGHTVECLWYCSEHTSSCGYAHGVSSHTLNVLLAPKRAIDCRYWSQLRPLDRVHVGP
jgi:hypothetical protein